MRRIHADPHDEWPGDTCHNIKGSITEKFPGVQDAIGRMLRPHILYKGSETVGRGRDTILGGRKADAPGGRADSNCGVMARSANSAKAQLRVSGEPKKEFPFKDTDLNRHRPKGCNTPGLLQRQDAKWNLKRELKSAQRGVAIKERCQRLCTAKVAVVTESEYTAITQSRVGSGQSTV